MKIHITNENIVIHELVGLNVTVLFHSDPTLAGIEGKVVGETMKTLLIKTDKGIKVVPKKYATFCFVLPKGKKTVVRGEEILYKPWERTKRAYKKFLKRKFGKTEC